MNDNLVWVLIWVLVGMICVSLIWVNDKFNGVKIRLTGIETALEMREIIKSQCKEE